MKATEFFKNGLLLVIENYGGNIVDYAVVVDNDACYHLWKFNPYKQEYQRKSMSKDLKEIFSILEKAILNNPKIEE